MQTYMLQGGTAINYGRIPASMRGLGIGPWPEETPAPTTPTTTPTDSGGNKITWGNVADIFKTIANNVTKPSSGGYSPNLPPAPAPQKSNALKYALIGGGILAAAGVTYLIVKSVNKKKSKKD